MRILNITESTAAIFFIFLMASPPVNADHATMEIHNNSRQAIMSFYAAPIYQNNWGTERLGTSLVLPPGYMQQFDLSDGVTNNCLYHLKVVMQNGAEYTKRSQNVCGLRLVVNEDETTAPEADSPPALPIPPRASTVNPYSGPPAGTSPPSGSREAYRTKLSSMSCEQILAEQRKNEAELNSLDRQIDMAMSRSRSACRGSSEINCIYANANAERLLNRKVRLSDKNMDVVSALEENNCQ